MQGPRRPDGSAFMHGVVATLAVSLTKAMLTRRKHFSRAAGENSEEAASTDDPLAVPAHATRIASLEAHRAILREALSTATREVVIVSPTISDAAVAHDDIPGLIRQARRRGVWVTIYTDSQLDTDENGVRIRSKRGRQMLRDAGARLHVISRVHNKSLSIDDHTLVEGSFNWLSANRNAESPHQKFETSWMTRGGAVAQNIVRLKREMERRRPVRAGSDRSTANRNRGFRFRERRSPSTGLA